MVATLARELCLALIVDDGVRGRGHRENIFNPNLQMWLEQPTVRTPDWAAFAVSIFASGYVENRCAHRKRTHRSSF